MIHAIEGMAKITMDETAKLGLCAQMYRELAHIVAPNSRRWK
jgi:hypothetical protein